MYQELKTALLRGGYDYDAAQARIKYFVREGDITPDQADELTDIAQANATVKSQIAQDVAALAQEVREIGGVITAQRDELLAVTASVMSDDQAAEHADVWPEWREGTRYTVGQALRHEGGLYRVRQTHIAQAHQPPDAGGMLAVYTPLQVATEGQILPWVYGEADVRQGDRRAYKDTVYICIGAGGAGANVWTPDTAHSVWRAEG